MKQKERRINNGQTETISDFSGRTVCELAGSQSYHQGEPWNVANLIDPVCIKP